MSSGADLFVVCKQCGAEVSRYITECPYCGTRLRKRAPKLSMPLPEHEPRRQRRPRSAAQHRVARLRGGGRTALRPAILAQGWPLASGLFVAASILLWVLARGAVIDNGQLAVLGDPHGQLWRLLTTSLVYSGTFGSYVYAWTALATIAVFGAHFERQLGPIATLVLLIGAGLAGALATLALYPRSAVALGGNSCALAALAAWALPEYRRALRRARYEADLLGVTALMLLLLLIPAARSEASWIAGVAGLLIGALAGAALGVLRARES